MPISFTLRQLEYFVAVAEQGSVTAAAACRNVSQPSVSVAISDLEAMLGRVLFRRQAGHTLSITPAGRRLLVQARTALAAASQISATGQDSLAAEELSICCFRDLGSIYLPGILTAFAKLHPGLTYRLSEGDLADVRAKVLDGRFELAITYDIDLHKHGVARSTIDHLLPHALLAQDHPLANAKLIALTDLAGERIVLEDFPVTNDYFVGLFKRHGLEGLSIQMVPSFEMQRGLVANGWGVGLSCVRPKPDFSYDGSPLVCLPLSSAEPMQEVVIAHLGEATLSHAARHFLKVARQSDRSRPR
jgi:DNA-binding transcriptional LysR family regulator